MERAIGMVVASAVTVSLALALGVDAMPTAAQAADETAEPETAATESIDRRPALLAHLGTPDAWVITADEIDGELARFESWMYHQVATQIDLKDQRIPDAMFLVGEQLLLGFVDDQLVHAEAIVLTPDAK